MTVGSFASPERAAELKSLAINLPSVILDWFQLQDYELLASGITAPLSSYAGRSDYESVLESMRLADGRLMPLPVCLRIDQNAAREIESSKSVALRDEEGYLLAVLHASEIWQPDMDKEARALYGVVDCERIGVSRCLNQDANLYCSGDLEILDYPVHYDFSSLRPRPDQVKNTAADLGWNNMVGFITASPIHKPQFEMTRDIMDRVDAGLLLMPIVGSSRRMEVGRYTRVRCYKAVAPYYPDGRIMMSLLPLSMRLAGPREALWQAMIARNFGCTHFIVRPWQSSPEKKGNATVNGIGPDSALRLLQQHEAEVGIKIEWCSNDGGTYCVGLDAVSTDEKPAPGVENDVGGLVMNYIRRGENPPDTMTFPEVVRELKRDYPPPSEIGFTVFMTGYSGAGKSTLAKILYAFFLEVGTRPVTLLDGDIVRRHISNDLGFSKDDRDKNIRRIGFVAGEITKNRGIAICAPIAPYARTRNDIRDRIERYGGFVEVHVATPLETCEERDRKGIYAKARKGLIKNFTGIDDPYEPPQQPEVRVDTTALTPEQAARKIMEYLFSKGYCRDDQPL